MARIIQKVWRGTVDWLDKIIVHEKGSSWEQGKMLVKIPK